MHVVIIGAHPDDPESGAGGLALRAVATGHRVVFLYLTSGNPEGGPGPREEEALAACRIIGAEPHFFRYPDPGVPLDREATARLAAFLTGMRAEAVFAHWPADTHPDHQATGALAIRAVRGTGTGLACYEVIAGRQSLAFVPDRLVDIGAVAERKYHAVACHASQNLPEWWPDHDRMEQFRGAEMGVTRAEGFRVLFRTPALERLFADLAGG